MRFLFASFAISGLLITYGLSAWLEPNLLRGLPSEEQWHGGLIFLIALTAIAAAMFHDYPVRRAHPQHARRYAAMTGMYRRALDALDEAERESPGRTADDGPALSRIEIARA